ncbi:type I pantothenate kinase [Carnobacteriaceae bacterium zg-ZUI78]|nr:type I pantothenate kinase [Carnobacteriaceae bacterium zg-ZUI78]
MEHYSQFSREAWKTFGVAYDIHLTEDTLKKLTSLNDRVSLDDVTDIYMPMVRLFDLYLKHHIEKQSSLQDFLNQPKRKVPFIIGISGSVSVGKSTTARLLQTMLQQLYPNKQIELMTTDGFLLTTATLKERGILDKKGFPESYDMERLVSFLMAVKTSDEPVLAPVYSHEIYDIIPDTYQTVQQPDVLIVEGINVLQLPPNRDIYVSDFFDWAIYVDAEPVNIEKWYLQRFEMLMDLAKNNPSNYYYKYAIGKREDAIAMAKEVWKNTNLKNLVEFILPTKTRADLVLHKTENHLIDYVLLKNY